jgi:hypothetical protein
MSLSEKPVPTFPGHALDQNLNQAPSTTPFSGTAVGRVPAGRDHA